mmetsp:Transcript_8668/g.22122  ORF Transcript_8668/g.22122 Transcript_8668/m.22122 type:complete len:308 (+) Transcript_8668:243-1166(+)
MMPKQPDCGVVAAEQRADGGRPGTRREEKQRDDTRATRGSRKTRGCLVGRVPGSRREHRGPWWEVHNRARGIDGVRGGTMRATLLNEAFSTEARKLGEVDILAAGGVGVDGTARPAVEDAFGFAEAVALEAEDDEKAPEQEVEIVGTNRLFLAEEGCGDPIHGGRLFFVLDDGVVEEHGANGRPDDEEEHQAEEDAERTDAAFFEAVVIDDAVRDTPHDRHAEHREEGKAPDLDRRHGHDRVERRPSRRVLAAETDVKAILHAEDDGEEVKRRGDDVHLLTAKERLIRGRVAVLQRRPAFDEVDQPG